MEDAAEPRQTRFGPGGVQPSAAPAAPLPDAPGGEVENTPDDVPEEMAQDTPGVAAAVSREDVPVSDLLDMGLEALLHHFRKEIDMADDKSKVGKPDRMRINVYEDYELRHWSQKFGVSTDRLKAAVGKVGPMADDVARELGKST